MNGMVVGILLPLMGTALGAACVFLMKKSIPETQAGVHSNMGTIGFSLGFALMMTLDVLLG